MLQFLVTHQMDAQCHFLRTYKVDATLSFHCERDKVWISLQLLAGEFL